LRYLVTGAAGFIGYHVAARLLERGEDVLGLDDVNPYYDVRLKRARLARLSECAGFWFREAGLGDRAAVEQVFAEYRPEIVIHLAAQAGVRHSLSFPHAYGDANLTGFLHVLEGCRHANVRHLVFASSSSVYGASTKRPYSERDPVGHPLSLYAATKVAGEAMAHAYSDLFEIPATGLRFFTVYGPWGRPDMAYYSFTRDIIDGRPIRLFNAGRMRRDFTYIDDAVEAVLRVAALPPTADPDWSAAAGLGTSRAPWRVLNVGAGHHVDLEQFLQTIERAVGRNAIREDAPPAPGDLLDTWSDTTALERLTGFRPATPLDVGIPRFVEWFRDYHSDTFA
jgi:UDP-glucuronate 4-epimerase